MATAVLALSATKFVIDTVNLLTHEEYLRTGCQLFCCLPSDLGSLKSSLSNILAVLEDAASRRGLSRADLDWLEKLRDAACHAEDAVDRFHWGILWQQSASAHSCCAGMVDFFSWRNSVLLRCGMVLKVKDAKQNIDDVAETSKLRLASGVPITSRNVEEERSQVHSFVIPSQVLGRDAERDDVIAALLDGNRAGDVVLVSIVGMGGLGKTTLAQLVRNDHRVADHFDPIIWITVPAQSSRTNIMKSIVELATKNVCEVSQMDALKDKVQEALDGKRFLLVLDDVWSHNLAYWEGGLRPLLVRRRSVGSRVLVTSRSIEVAEAMRSSATVTLKPLPDDACWELFKSFAFEDGLEKPPKLVQYGREIVRKCRGVPLAVQAVAGLMRFKDDEIEWANMAESNVWSLLREENGIDITPVLRLSYEYLSPRSKHCFAFCSVFPQDYEIECERLMHMWIANGFITVPSDLGLDSAGSALALDLRGRTVFSDLLRRSFLL